jgi:hypothetical protein
VRSAAKPGHEYGDDSHLIRTGAPIILGGEFLRTIDESRRDRSEDLAVQWLCPHPIIASSAIYRH